MPSLDLLPDIEPTSNGNSLHHIPPVPGPVRDTFDGAVAQRSGSVSPNLEETASNSESDDPHGVTEINKRRHGMHRSRTSRTSMALTDYSVNPSTPSDLKRQHIRDLIPEDFLLPNGHPDVGGSIAVSLPHRNANN
jgi:hypothetical protein